MRALRFRPALVLAATVALCGCDAHPLEGGLLLDRTQEGALTRDIDQQLNQVLNEMIASTEVSPDGEIFYNRPLSDGGFVDPNSGRYWQISGEGQEDFPSRSLWDRGLKVSGRKAWTEPLYYNSDQFPNEPLRVAERTVRLPGSDVEWQFVVAKAIDGDSN